jgi:hypothetical protein
MKPYHQKKRKLKKIFNQNRFISLKFMYNIRIFIVCVVLYGTIFLEKKKTKSNTAHRIRIRIQIQREWKRESIEIFKS